MTALLSLCLKRYEKLDPDQLSGYRFNFGGASRVSQINKSTTVITYTKIQVSSEKFAQGNSLKKLGSRV